jgi:transglutaminase-like putative cysteine protease
MRLVAFVTALCLAALPLAAQTLTLAIEPTWADIAPVPQGDAALRAEVEGGQFFLLSDHQMRWEGDVKQSYSRTVVEVTDRAGLEELATIKIDFDPANETVSLVRLEILRGDQVIDLKDKVSPQVYRRETRLDEGIIDGTLTAVVQVPDLRVGDVLDEATLLESRPVLGAGERGGSSWLEWSTPVVLSRALVTWSEGEPLELGPLPARVTHSITALGDGQVRHEWRREGHIPPVEEEGVPSEVIEDALLRFSSTRDWTPLTKVLAPYYTRDYPLPTDWEAKVAEIALDYPTLDARAYAALRLVQDELRYVSLSVGAGGYLARPPEEVIAAGFGDCKDKSLLLRVILNRLGVEAAVALTDLDAGYGLPEELPMLGVFDHMILRATLNGRAVWMDPTGSHEGGGLGTAVEPDYGYALPLTATGPAALERMEVTPQGTWAQEVREAYDFSMMGLVLTVETLNLSGAADSTRARWATTPVSQIGREFLDFYRKRYPGLTEAKPPRMTDDRAANRVTVVETYFLPFTALNDDSLRQDFAFASNGLVSRFPEPQSTPRRLPMDVGGPWSFTHVVEVSDAPIDFNPPDDVMISNPAFDFSLKGTATEGGNLRLAWTYVPKTHAVPADQVAGVLQDVQAVRDATWYSWDLTPE